MDENPGKNRFTRYAQTIGHAGPAVVLAIIALLILQYTWDALFHPHVILEALSVPKELEEKGLTGQVIASRLIDRMKYMEAVAQRPDKGPAPRTQPPETPFKVQISGAGVSIDELGTYLRSLISHDTYLSGEIVRSDGLLDIRFRKTIRENSAVICGLRVDATSWENDSASCLYRNLQPDRYARFLLNRNEALGGKEEGCPGPVADEAKRTGKQTSDFWLDRTRTRALAEKYFRYALASTTASHELAWALEGLGYQRMHDAKFLRDRVRCGQISKWQKYTSLEQFNAVYDEAERDFGKSLAYDPHFVVTREHLAELEGNIGRDESSYQRTKELISVMTTDPLADGTYPKGSPTFQVLLDQYQAGLLEAKGDYDGGRRRRVDAIQLAKTTADPEALRWVRPDDTFPVDATFLHERVACCTKWNDTQILALAGSERWPDILSICTDKSGLTSACPNPTDWPWVAKAYSQTGNQKKAMAVVDQSLYWTAPRICKESVCSVDRANSWCYLCWRVRAWVEANSKHWPAAIADMEHAIALAPDLPFAHVEFADIYRREPNLDAAEAEARRAIQLGPHYGDALEIWGEILMDRGDYAAAEKKFAAARQIAPQWSKLLQEWQQSKSALATRQQ